MKKLTLIVFLIFGITVGAICGCILSIAFHLDNTFNQRLGAALLGSFIMFLILFKILKHDR